MIDYTGLNELLWQAQADASAANCHGFLCGQICVAGMPEEDLWQEYLDVQSDNDTLVFECYQEIHHLVADIAELIRSSDLDFRIMLPDEGSTLADRLQALSEWCEGFLNGLGLGAAQGGLPLTEDCQEIVDDYTKISRVGLEDEGDENDEQALTELIEYVRVGALLIFDEMCPAHSTEQRPELLH